MLTTAGPVRTDALLCVCLLICGCPSLALPDKIHADQKSALIKTPLPPGIDASHVWLRVTYEACLHLEAVRVHLPCAVPPMRNGSQGGLAHVAYRSRQSSSWGHMESG
eukprot:SAG11_NODE_2335_length_3504_cov_2.100734_1_plen_108_part_00